jgi:hypothetical protein
MRAPNVDPPDRRREAVGAPAKFLQINPSKSKEKGLDFLGFLWWNPDFSMGYGESK